jgi:hypothetical protein
VPPHTYKFRDQTVASILRPPPPPSFPYHKRLVALIQWRRRRSCRRASSERRGRTSTTAGGCGPSRPSTAAPSPRLRSPPPPPSPSSTLPMMSSPALPAPASPSQQNSGTPPSRAFEFFWYAWKFYLNRIGLVSAGRLLRPGRSSSCSRVASWGRGWCSSSSSSPACSSSPVRDAIFCGVIL